jgi:hypothetical protein
LSESEEESGEVAEAHQESIGTFFILIFGLF